MKDNEITKFLVSFTGQIEYVTLPDGVFDDQSYIQYETVWGPDWAPVSGLTSGTSQMARSGVDPERIIFNLPLDMVFSSTNVSGCKYTNFETLKSSIEYLYIISALLVIYSYVLIVQALYCSVTFKAY